MTKHLKQFLLRWLPYVIIAAIGTKLGHAWRLTEHLSFSERILRLPEAMTLVFQNLLLSIHVHDVFFGVFIGVALKVVVYLKGKRLKSTEKTSNTAPLDGAQVLISNLLWIQFQRTISS